MYKKVIIAVVVSAVSVVAHAACTIKYACGTGATGTAPENQSVANGGRVFTPSANTCTYDGYVFSHYLATVSTYRYANDGVAHPGVEYTIPFNETYSCSNATTITLTAQWVAASPTTTTSKQYTDTQIATRQPRFIGDANGTNKLMLFSGTTDGEILSRDIVNTLGTQDVQTGDYVDTESDAVAIAAAVDSGLRSKQDTLIGGKLTFATYTGAAGITGSKEVYWPTTSQYADGLVSADILNTAVIEAVNSELLQVDENGTPSNSGTLWQLNDNLELLPFSEINLTELLTKAPSGYSSRRLQAGSVTQSNMNIQPYIGSWVVGYSGTATQQLFGISACSTQVPNGSDAASNQAAVQADYINNMENAPTKSPVGRYCFCKLTYPNISTPRWIAGSGSYTSVSACAQNCASQCVQNLRNTSSTAFKRRLFGLAQ